MDLVWVVSVDGENIRRVTYLKWADTGATGYFGGCYYGVRSLTHEVFRSTQPKLSHFDFIINSTEEFWKCLVDWKSIVLCGRGKHNSIPKPNQYSRAFP